MRIRALIFLLLIVPGFKSVAQVLVGPVAGANVSWITYDDKDYKDYYGISPVIGFHAGAQVSFRVQKRFFLNTSLIYSTKGKLEKGKLDATYRNQARYNYIEIPIVYTAEFKGNFGKGNRQYKWYIGAGPNVSYWLGGKGKISSSDLEEGSVSQLKYKIAFEKEEENVDYDQLGIQNPNRIQLGLNIATGFVFEPIGYHKVMVLFRYELGHTFLSGDSNGVLKGLTYQDNMRVRNQGFRVSLSYLIDLKTAERKKGKTTLNKNKRG